ncbi:MAG: type II secretion system protein [Pseudomonadota bacterium]
MRQYSKGFTLIELIVTVTIVSILASVTMPMLKMTVQRSKETELRANLRQIREAIDAYKKAADEGRIKKNIQDNGYPPNLEVLVNGVLDEKDVNKRQLKFLRRIPLDPMTNIANADTEALPNNWGLRSYESDAVEPVAGDDVYDVYSLSPQIGINGVPYAKW